MPAKAALGGWAMRRVALWGFALICAVATEANADSQSPQFGDEPWSVTVFTGPSTTKYFFAVFSSGRLQPTGVGTGIALDRKLFHVTSDLSITAEANVVQTYFGHYDTELSAGLGFQWNEPFGFPYTSLSGYDGMSEATDPAYTSIGYGNRVYPSERTRFLNYMSVEWTAAFNRTSQWDLVFRLFHRSGAFGLVSEGDDAGLVMGVGVRRRF
jgi:hypothetical protein